jgi:hypothetical protein
VVGISLKRLLREILLTRKLPGGGLADRPKGEFRVDSTVWGILALLAAEEPIDSLEQSRARLRSEQEDDGRVGIGRGHSNSYWPTPLAILAWQNSPACHDAQIRAVQVLLATTGEHPARKPDDPWAHDTALKGWPWIQGTHAWVEPTATCVIALRRSGYGSHDRVNEAIRMLLDRQLPHGGWNSGNTLIFGRELHPNPEGTGAALLGVVDVVDQGKVVRSIEYLQGEVNRLRTPISLGWALLGLGAWGHWPSNGHALVERCLAQQSRYGEYETSALCLLFLGAFAGEASATFPLFINSSGNRATGVLVQ